jgi:hypothetical protein
VLPGDGIGPEIVGATLDMLGEADRIFGLGLTFETAAIGFDSLRTAGTRSRIVVWVRPRDDLSTKGRRVLLVSRVRHLFGLHCTSLLELHFAQDLSGATWCPFIPRDNVLSGRGGRG